MTALKTDIAGKTPTELLARYKWHLIGLMLLVFMAIRFAYTFVALAALLVVVCLIVGWKDPGNFRFLFGDRTSKKVVGWSFGGLLVLLCGVASSLDPANVDTMPDGGSATPPTSAPAPVQAASNPEGASPRANMHNGSAQKAASQEREVAARNRARLALGIKVARDKQAMRERAAREKQAAAEAKSAPSDSTAANDALPSNVVVVNLPGVGKRQVGRVDKVDYAILSTESANSIGTTRADGTFLILHVAASNTDKKTHNVTTSFMKLLDGKDREFSASSEGNTALMMTGNEEAKFVSTQVQPGIMKRFALVYDLPDDVIDLRLKIPAGTFSFGPDATIEVPAWND